jgi:type II secretory pathway component PulK
MNRSHLSKQSSGVALIIVLWAVSLIATAMLGLAVLMERQIGQEVAALQNARAMLVAESGIQMVLNPELLPGDVEAASQQLSARLQEGWKVGKATVPVKFTIRTEDMKGEGGKVNINALLLGNKAIARSILQNLFAQWEVNLTTSSALIDALLDWVDADQLSSGSNSATEVNVRNGPFEKIDELEKVVGWAEMAKEAKEGGKGVDAIKKFTVFGTGKLSLRSADQDVIEAWLELSPGSAKNFINARPGMDKIDGTADDVVDLNSLVVPVPADWSDRITNEQEDLWRVTSTGSVGEATRKVVALISRKTNPPQVKARWTDEEFP